MYNRDSSWNWSTKSLSSPSLLVLFPQLFNFLIMCCALVHLCLWRLWLKTFSISSVQFLQSVCLHPVLSCAYASCTLCLSSFHHDDYACILLCLLLSTYSAASSSSLRNFLTGKFLYLSNGCLSSFVCNDWRKYALEAIIKLFFLSSYHDKCLLFMLELY